MSFDGVSTAICDNCHSRFRLGSTKSMFAERDSVRCRICGEILHSERSSRTYFIEETLEERHDHESPD